MPLVQTTRAREACMLCRLRKRKCTQSHQQLGVCELCATEGRVCMYESTGEVFPTTSAQVATLTPITPRKRPSSEAKQVNPQGDEGSESYSISLEGVAAYKRCAVRQKRETPTKPDFGFIRSPRRPRLKLVTTTLLHPGFTTPPPVMLARCSLPKLNTPPNNHAAPTPWSAGLLLLSSPPSMLQASSSSVPSFDFAASAPHLGQQQQPTTTESAEASHCSLSIPEHRFVNFLQTNDFLEYLESGGMMPATATATAAASTQPISGTAGRDANSFKSDGGRGGLHHFEAQNAAWDGGDVTGCNVMVNGFGLGYGGENDEDEDEEGCYNHQQRQRQQQQLLNNEIDDVLRFVDQFVDWEVATDFACLPSPLLYLSPKE